jgi:hypothetical protein
MKSFFSLFLLVLLGMLGYLPSIAQQYFNKRYTLNSNSCIISGALAHNGKYYSTAISLDSSNYDIGSGGFFNRWGVRFTSYDSVGNILKDTIYQRKDRKFIDTWSNNLRVLPDGTFLLAANAADTAVMFGQYISYTCLLQFDSTGKLLTYKEFTRPYCLTSDATYHIVFDFKPDAYGNWLMLSSMLCNGNRVVFNLRKLDSHFDELWVKNYSTSGYHHTPKHLLIEEDGYVMTGGIDNGNTMLHANYYSSVLIKCDTAGNKIWDWQNTFDTTRLQYTINDILRSKDGGYVYCGTGEGRPMYYASGEWADIITKSWVEKLDVARNSVWKRAIGLAKASIKATQQTVVKERPNGDVIVAGATVDLFDITDETDGWIRGSLTRLSGVDGTVIWQRKYKSPDGNDTMYLSIYDMRPTSDGGYILAGEAKNVIDRKVGPIQRGWLIKVDSNGCEWAGSPCNPTAVHDITIDRGTCSVYPNPSDGDFIVAFNSTNKSKAQLSIYDLLGRQLIQQTISIGTSTITAKEWPNGIYLYRLSQNGQLLQSGKLMKQ